MSAVCICTPLSSFVSVGKNSRSIAVVVISAGCSAGHPNIISDSWITPAKNASVFFDLLKILLTVSELPRTTEAFHIDGTRRVFPNVSCREIVDCSHCIGKSRFCCHLSSQREQLLMKLCDNLLNGQRHETTNRRLQISKRRFLVLFLKQIVPWPTARTPWRSFVPHVAVSTPVLNIHSPLRSESVVSRKRHQVACSLGPRTKK